MKLIFSTLLLLAIIQNATAETTFSFAGLHWGDSIDTVDSRLKAAGFSGCALLEKMTCKIGKTCDCGFTGPGIKHGSAGFDGKKLDRVSVFVDDNLAMREVLRRKYGQPLPQQNAPRSNNPFLDRNFLRWRALTGETLEIDFPGPIVYTSGTYNKKEEQREKSETSMF